MKERNTKQRKMVWDAVKARTNHPTANQIFLDVLQQDARISQGTVYRNLNLLCEKGEITEVDVPEANRYDCRTDRHYHMLCRICGEVFDAPVEYEDAKDERIKELTGFQVEGHDTIFRGICKQCLEKV